MEKLRILYVGPVPPEVGGRRPGGIATHCWELAREASRRGYEVFVLGTDMLVALDSEGDIKDSIALPGLNDPVAIPVVRKARKVLRAFQYSKSIPKDTQRVLNALPFRERIRVMYTVPVLDRVVRAVEPDVAHVHSLHSNVSMALRALNARLPIVVEHYEIWPLPPKSAVLKRVQASLDASSYVVCSSEYGRKQIINEGLRNKRPTKVIPIPVDSKRIPFLDRESARRELGLAKEKKVVFFSGVHQPVRKKGLDILLKAFKSDSSLSRFCTLLLRTNGEGARYARKVAASMKELDVRILEEVEWDTLIQCYNAADVFVMPSRSEGFGIVYSEALLAGSPVVGFSWTIETLQTLLGVRVGEPFDASVEDERSLARKIRSTLEEPFDRLTLRERTAEALSWDRLFREYATVYDELLTSTEGS